MTGLTFGAERRRHPTYRRRTVYWATVYDAGKRPIAQMGPYRDKRQALFAAQSMKEHRESRPMMYERKHVPGPRVDLPGLELPATAPDPSGLAKRQAAAPMRPPAPQKPCDHGLFSDGGGQSDLVDMARRS